MDNSLIVKHVSWHDTYLRWVALGLACIMQMGNYFSYDFPAVLQKQIQDQFHVSEFDYNLLYSVYSLPNIVLPLFGGVLIDQIGIRKGIVLFSIPLLIGQGLCILGSWTNTYYWLIIGRVMYGIGGENMSVVQSSIVSKWFAGKEMAFALGLNITLSRIGSIMNSVITPKVYKIQGNITLSLMVGFGFLIVSWMSCLAMAIMDKKSDERDRNKGTVEVEKITWKDCKEFKIDLLMVVFSCMVCYTNLFVFQQNNISMFEQLYKLSGDKANVMYQIPFYQGAALTPFMGILIDRVGQRPMLLILSGFLLMSVDVWYMLMPSCNESCVFVPIMGQIVLGIFYTFYAAVLWPTVPLCVPAKTVGTAFGVTNAVQNFGLATGPLVVGIIISGATEQPSRYRYMMLFFLAIAGAAQLNNIALKIYDMKYLRNKLSWSQKETNANQVTPMEKSENMSMPPYDS